jgi:hypothetical protein
MWLAVMLVGVACADEMPEDVTQRMEAARDSTEAESADTAAAQADLEGLLRAAPSGSHVDWIRDIRVGLDSVPAEAALDRGDALYRVQELYTRRFEALRIFYGAGGAIDAGVAVTQAVEDASTHLQDLMRLLATDASDAATIEQSVRSSQDALDRVGVATREAGVPRESPRDTVIIEA